MSSSLFSKLWPNARTPRKKRRKKKRRKRSAHGTATPGITAIEKLVVEEIEIADVGTLPVGAPRTRKRKSRPAWILATKTVATWVGLALLPVLAALAVRSPWPVDETRTLAVAWEMWLRGDLLVPHLDGAVYSDQPPLFFWLITYGWGVLGVNGWWPRLRIWRREDMPARLVSRMPSSCTSAPLENTLSAPVSTTTESEKFLPSS